MTKQENQATSRHVVLNSIQDRIVERPRNSSIKNVCVFSSSSNTLPGIYYEAAKELGILMAKEGYDLVYGAGCVGTMGVNAQAVRDFGGKIIGIIPEKLWKLEVGREDCDELFITKGMRDRKQKLDEVSDAVISLAGGYGTLEELSEMIVQKQLGYTDKAIVILNTNGFYDNLLKFFDEIIQQNFAIPETQQFYYVAKTPKEAIDYLKTYAPEKIDMSKKFPIKINPEK